MDPLIRKLEAFGPLPAADRRHIEAVAAPAQKLEADVDIITEGDRPRDVTLILSGFACRYKLLSNGERHIVAFLLPGDICDLHAFTLDVRDHNVGTLTAAWITKLAQRDVLALLERPAIARALLITSLVEEATSREWLANIGQRPAEQRLAHLFCEWHLRLKAIGLTSDGGCELPVNQSQLGDTLGLSTVHINRSLQSLRDQGLITLKSRRLVIPDFEKLRRMTGFLPNYLHLGAEAKARHS